MVVEDDDATREFLADHLAADSYGVVTGNESHEWEFCFRDGRLVFKRSVAKELRT